MERREKMEGPQMGRKRQERPRGRESHDFRSSQEPSRLTAHNYGADQQTNRPRQQKTGGSRARRPETRMDRG